LLRTHITEGKTPVPYSSLITFEPSAFERVLFSSDPVDRLQVQQMRADFGGSLMEVLNHLTSQEGRS
jgi:hypothetical protein